MTKHLISLTAIIVVVCFASCTGNKQKNDAQGLNTIGKEQVKADVTEFVYPMPTAFEVTEMLNRIGASYILSLSNPVENSEKYFTEKSKALNLGVYGADLSYASTYNQKQIAIDYMNASNKLIEELGFSNAIDDKLIEKIEQAENNKDQLVEIITNTFYSTYDYLNKNNRAAVSIMVLAGSWVEGLYIATHISEDTYNNVEMVKLIMGQKESLDKLFELFSQFDQNADMAEIKIMFSKINELYNSLSDGSISQQQMEAITNEIAVLRAKIVS